MGSQECGLLLKLPSPHPILPLTRSLYPPHPPKKKKQQQQQPLLAPALFPKFHLTHPTLQEGLYAHRLPFEDDYSSGSRANPIVLF